MGRPFKKLDPDQVREHAWDYIQECMAATKEIITMKGVQEIKERHLPTIQYFLMIWMRLNDHELYHRCHFYKAMNNADHPLSNTIKEIDEVFKALAVDIVANEGKGIFYAKNRLGMTDKHEAKVDQTLTNVTVSHIPAVVPVAGSEKDIHE